MLGQLRAPEGARRKPKRVGRGPGSGHGKTACRGSKGQRARSGSPIRPGFEGGQMPLQRRLPKRGFTNVFHKEYALINVRDLNRFEDGAVVTPEVLREHGLVRKKLIDGVKVLGEGELERRVVVHAHKFSASAARKITERGGAVVEL